ncbi:hypothetical protein [Hanstruepera flava]|uniref:hypothetical protein n=1 Tax=Hanstruepera flava TaxID=2930218 RepID=UPI002028E421|nr:hypothetical protein [Hanstruepera flava]
MKWAFYFLFFFSVHLYSQDSLKAVLVESSPLKVQSIIGTDNFDAQYYINNNVFYKKIDSKTINFSAIQLGEIASTDIYNPLKMILFYKDFNTVIVLDNRLADIYKIDFNVRQPYRNVSHVSVGNDNTIWTFNQDLQQLQLYDYLNNQIRATALPVVSNVLHLASNYNYAWLLTENYIYKYSYFGSMLYKIKNDGYTVAEERNDDVILKKDNKLYFLKDKTEEIIPIILPELLINQFFVTGETLYIYDSETLYKFQLKNY